MLQKLQHPHWVDLQEITQFRAHCRDHRQSFVLTNGCFDLLHPGHLFFLQSAARLGDVLCVGLNSSTSIQQLKGPLRPIQSDAERAFTLASLACVQRVFLFFSTEFTAAIEALQPDIYVKAGDYNLSSLNPNEHQMLQKLKTNIVFLPFFEGYSTTKLIQKICSSATSA